MHRITYTQGVTIEAADGQTLLEASIQNRIPHHHQCGARARCTTCRVRILDGLAHVSARTALEESVASQRGWDEFTRLACQTRVFGDVVARRLLQSPQDIVFLDIDELHGTTGEDESELDVAVLFCDIRNFTSQTEHSLPYDVVYFLNGYFAAAAEVILNNNGFIDKYIGDGILAVFGIRNEQPAVACRNAVRAAIGMQDAARRLSPIFERDLGISLRIGIHYGPVILGRIGHPGKRQITVIGDTVNTASRIERMTKELDAPVLLSDRVIAHVQGALCIGSSMPLRLKGKTRTMVLSRCDGFASPDAVHLVQSSFHQVAARLQAFGKRFYEILFEAHPELRSLFKDDLTVQTRMLVSMLNSLVKGLNRVPDIEGGLRMLGGRHHVYQATAADYDKVAGALMAALEEFLGDDFTPAVRDAWGAVYGTISKLMMQGATCPAAAGTASSVIRASRAWESAATSQS